MITEKQFEDSIRIIRQYVTERQKNKTLLSDEFIKDAANSFDTYYSKRMLIFMKQIRSYGIVYLEDINFDAVKKCRNVGHGTWEKFNDYRMKYLLNK